MIVNLAHAVALAGVFVAVSPMHALSQDAAESVPVTPMPLWMRFAFFSLFAFALAAGGVAIGAAFRNKVIYTLTRGLIGTLLGAAFMVQFAPAWLYLMGPVFLAFVVIGFQRYLAIFNDRSTPGPGWQWSRPPRSRHWRRYNLRAGVWEGHAHLLAVAALVVGLAVTTTAQKLPEPVGRINDFASILDEATKKELDTLLESVERETTAQIAVATVPSLERTTVDEYALKLFNAWGIGQKDKNNGVLVLVAPTEREMRIEVGYGLEGVLPDGLAGHLIRTEFTPSFREGNYRQGIVAGVRRIAEIVRRNERLTPEQIAALSAPEESLGAFAWVMGLSLMPFILVGGHFFGVGLRHGGMEKLIGAVFGGAALFMSLVASPWMFLVLLVIAVITFINAYRRGSQILATRDIGDFIGGGTSESGRSSSKGWTSSSSSSSSGSSSRSSGFGGGRSGGGGASGKW